MQLFQTPYLTTISNNVSDFQRQFPESDSIIEFSWIYVDQNYLLETNDFTAL